MTLISKARQTPSRASQVNPNSDWLNLRGAWTTNLVVLVAIRLFFAIIPVGLNFTSARCCNGLCLLSALTPTHMMTFTHRA